MAQLVVLPIMGTTHLELDKDNLRSWKRAININVNSYCLLPCITVVYLAQAAFLIWERVYTKYDIMAPRFLNFVRVRLPFFLSCVM